MRRIDVLILGQGLAGTLLAWELEQAGIDFQITDAGPAGAASAVAAGIVNPITGRRFVKSWRIDALLPVARTTYAALAAALGCPLWRELRVRRQFAEADERARFAARFERGELAPYAGPADDEGFWIEPAAHLDVPLLLRAARARWRRLGRLHEASGDPAAALSDFAVVVDCRGAATAERGPFSFVPWEFSKGEILEVTTAGLDRGVVLNRGTWLLPLAEDRALAGATHEPGVRAATLTVAGADKLAAAAADLLRRPFQIVGQYAGVRVTLADKRPVAGRHPAEPRLGLINALGAKGVSLAPWLAQQWRAHLTHGTPFDPEISVARFRA